MAAQSFYLRDAMPARVLAMALCVASQCSIKRDRWIVLIFGMEASFDETYI